MVIESVPVPDFISNKDRIDEARTMLIDSARALNIAGATALALGSNTVHILLHELQASSSVPFISMVDLVVNRCAEVGFNRIAILGTPVTLDSGLYSDPLRAKGITPITPIGQLDTLDSVIRTIIAGKTVEGQLRNQYDGLLETLLDQSDAIILGCTELPLVRNYEEFGNRVISSDEILAEGLVDYYYSS